MDTVNDAGADNGEVQVRDDASVSAALLGSLQGGVVPHEAEGATGNHAGNEAGNETGNQAGDKAGLFGDGAEQPQGVQMPGQNATPQQWAQFYEQIGRPQQPQDYELPLPQGDDGVFAKEMAPLLHQAGLTQHQAETLAQGWNAYMAQQVSAMQAQQEQQQAAREAQHQAEAQALKQEWQGRYDANIELARRARAQFLPADRADDIINALQDVVGVKATVQLLYEIGRGLAEDDAAGLGGSGRAQARSAAEVLFDRG